jgi:hypothetical protein
MMDASRSKAAEVTECKRESLRWMEANFYEEWTSVWRSYLCEREPEKDDDGNIDPTQTSIGMPDTFSHVQRNVARITAQSPDISYHAKDPMIGELIGRTLMYQWDKGKVQRGQKKHVRQASMFGWSVRAWWWCREEYMRRKRVDPLTADRETQELILRQYTSFNPALFWMLPPMLQALALARLAARYGKGGLLPVQYMYRGYQGPRCDFLFAGDCYPEPNFQDIQTSGYFIVERKRNYDWIEQVAKDIPEFSAGLNAFLRDKPNGTERRFYGDRDTTHLRSRLEAAVNRTGDEESTANKHTRKWTFTEMWIPGKDARLRLVGEDDYYIGEIPCPFDLEGKIPFTELVLIDDLLCGVGNSTARILRGIQQLHDRQVNQRVDLIYNILRPLIGTSNYELYANPDLVKRGKGFRIVKMRGPGDMWMQTEQAAMAAAAAGLNDESGIMRMWQMASGDSNLSMAANVDPQQNRTATGAKIAAANQDILTKDVNDMFLWSGLNADAEMMYLLNRSELTDPVELEAGKYYRKYGVEDPIRDQWVSVEPAMFQMDGEIIVESGSTLADDDESRVAQATALYGMFAGNPTVNQETLRDTVLIAHGKGRELQKWAAPKSAPPPPEFRGNASLAVKWEMLSDEEKQAWAEKLNLTPPPPPGGPMPPPPGALPPGMPPGGPPPMPEGM